MQAHRIIDCDSALQFMIAGNAYFTLRSARTGTRYTYRARRKDQSGPIFISCLYGSSNTEDYAYLGIIREGVFTLTSKSRFTPDSPQAKAFAWSHHRVMTEDRLPDELEFWHEGRCGRCGRLLTVPESIANGIGPECAKRSPTQSFKAELA